MRIRVRTIMSSSRVKAAATRFEPDHLTAVAPGGAPRSARSQPAGSRQVAPECPCARLPIGISGSIQSGPLAARGYVKDVPAASGARVGIVLQGSQRPFGLSRHGIHGDAAEEFVLCGAA